MFPALIHKVTCQNTTILPGYASSSIFTGSFGVNGSLHNIGATSGGTEINKEKLLCDWTIPFWRFLCPPEQSETNTENLNACRICVLWGPVGKPTDVLHGHTMHRRYQTLYCPTNAHIVKNVELLKQSKIKEAAATCFGLQGNRHHGATAST
jgi:hypothetical protein